MAFSSFDTYVLDDDYCSGLFDRVPKVGHVATACDNKIFESHRHSQSLSFVMFCVRKSIFGVQT
jgi:hypothetical protein